MGKNKTSLYPREPEMLWHTASIEPLRPISRGEIVIPDPGGSSFPIQVL